MIAGCPPGRSVHDYRRPKSVATGRIEKTQGNIFSYDEGTDVGRHDGTAVTQAYTVPFKFTGKIIKVTHGHRQQSRPGAQEVALR